MINVVVLSYYDGFIKFILDLCYSEGSLVYCRNIFCRFMSIIVDRIYW